MASGSVSRIRCFFKGEYLVKKEYEDKNIEIDSFIEDVEEKLIYIWEEVLRCDEITIDDNMYELGSNSLKVASIVSRIQKTMDVKIPLSEMFQLTTIRKQAEYIRGASKSKYEKIYPVSEKNYYETSSAEKRMYLMNQLECNSTTYNVPSVYIIKGELDKEKFKYAIQKVVDRHETLRTSFDVLNGKIVQRIHQDVNFEVEFKELDFCEQTKEGMNRCIREFIRPFDLSNYPLFRVCLVYIQDKEYMLMMDLHHIIADEVSNRIILREITEIYNGKELEILNIQYKDFSYWQNKLFKSDYLKRQEEYWGKTFAKDLSVLNMPTDFKRPAIKSFEGNHFDFRIDSELTQEIKQITEKTNTTLFMFLLAALNVFLYKYTGQEDIVVGIPIAGRMHEDVENVVGMFVNTLAMRNYPVGNKTFTDFLMELKENSIKAYENQEYQFEELLTKINVTRDVSRNPLFDVMFVMRNLENDSVSFQGCEMTSYAFTNRISKFDFTLIAFETVDEFRFTFEYCTKLFKRETIERFGEHFKNLLKAIVKNMDSSLSEIDIIGVEEKKRILYDFNRTQVEFSEEKTLPEMFSEQVEKTPDNIALVFGEQKLTYLELDQKARGLAKVLRDNSIGRNDIVAIMVDRSLEMIISILAIMKAGAAYLPIDITYPADRIKFMLEDSGTKLLLVKGKPEYEVTNGIRSIDLEDKDIFLNYQETLDVINVQEDLAYVIYTSGTTGKPKGVQVKHTGIISLSLFFKESLKVTDNDRIVQFASISFDASVWEIFMALLTGAQLHILTKDVINDYCKFTEYLNQNSITVATLPPTYLVNINPESVKSLNKLITAGSSISVDLFSKWQSHVKYINAYGPTETTICASVWEGEKLEFTQSVTSIPIGRPIYNTKIFIVDKNNHLQPIGVIGELCISGVGLAQGYLNRPELTSEKFVENPFFASNDDSHYFKMYHTGDLARWLPDGNIEFFGRIDQQVKIRGFRIELGEIETVLLKYDGIKEVAIIDKEDEDKNKYLCAYFVASREITVSKLREYLAQLLPDYMIPQYFVQISQIPLSNSGKVDRKELPNPTENINTGVEYIAAQNEIEKKLVDIWSKILNVKKIGVNDNFFELGGHSLKAVSLMTKIHKELEVEIPLSEVFRLITIKLQAEYIRDAVKSKYISIKLGEKKEFYNSSSAQKRMFLISRLEAEDTTYNIPKIFTIKGKLNVEKLECAFRELIKRHESFRTSFEVVSENVVQKIHENANFKLEIKELKNSENVEEYLQQYADEFVRPFDLGVYPLLRVMLLKVRDEEYLLFLDMHHIIADGESMEIFLREIKDLYEGKRLPSLKVQYKDFSEWQNKLLNSGLLESQKNYWLRVFSGEIPLLNMPLDYKRPVVKSTEGNRIHFVIDDDLTKKIRIVAEKTNTTIYMVLLAAFNVILYKYTGQEDIVVGTPFSGRIHEEVEDIIGMFVNTLGMRNYPEGSKKFREFLTELKENVLKAFENQDYPLEKLLVELDIKRDAGRNPLFDVMFAMQNHETGEMLGECQLESYKYDHRVSKFDITLIAVEAGEHLACVLEYCTKLFKKETIERFAVHFKNLLSAIVMDLDATLSDLNILGEEEKKQIVYDFNNTHVDFQRGKTVHELFLEQVERKPNNIAVVFGEQILTYDELNNKANSLANILCSKGIVPNDVIGIMVEPCVEMIIGVLAILKSGAAYLAIAADNPADRVSYMLKDSAMNILLSKKHLLDKVTFEGELIDLDEKELYLLSTENPAINNAATDTAYVIYTSGSTGNPKGVLVGHESLVNLSIWHQQNFQITESDRATKYAGFGFDASVWEIFPYLLAGAALYIIEEEKRLDINKLHDYCCENEISISFLPTQLCEQFMKFKDTSLKYLLTGGDKLTQFEQNSFTLVNNYGPTENTVVTSSFIVDKQYDSIPIGKPIYNSRIYIIDKYKHIQPIGVAGELCVSGIGLAKGYLNNPELTAEKFIDNPFVNHEEEDVYQRMYRTGDLARWLPDGNIEFLGRIDQQVKVRGYRIELGEIQTVLQKYDGIKDAVVIAKEDQDNNKYLCAYFVADTKISVSVLRSYLIQKLPDYMVPQFIIQLSNVPLTSNGKVDKQALPEPDGMINTGVKYEEPTTEIEKRLVSIWHEVLCVKRIGINDNFFELGGHSLRAVSLASKIHKELNVEIPISELFCRNTIRKQVEYIQNAVQSRYMAIVPVEEKKYYLVSSAQKRMYLLNQLDVESTTYNIPYAFTIYGDIDIERLEQTLQKIVNRHESFRTSFKVLDGDIVQQIHKDVKFVMEFKTIEEKSEEILQRCIDEFVRPFDLSTYPLIRASLVRIQKKEYLLMLDMHHIISDGVSMGIMFREMTEFYAGKTLPLVKRQYKDFSDWSNKRYQSGIVEKQERYWLDIFAGEIPLLNMPVDFNRPVLKSFAGDRIEFVLDSELTRALKEMAERTNTTMFMILLAAYNVLLYKYTGQEDIVIGTPISGRMYEEETDIIGMFVNTLAMRNYPEGKKTFREFLVELKENSLRAFENQEYQFEELLSKLEVKRDVSRNPLFDVMFVMQNLEDSSMKLSGCETIPYHFKSKISKFDITLIAVEASDKLQFIIEYCTALFTKETIERFRVHLENLLRGIVDNVDTRLREIDILGEEGRKELLKVFNKDQVKSNDMLIQELFWQQVKMTPNQIAVVIGEQQITYQELDKKSNSLASVLCKRGVGSNVIVGIMVERSIEMVIGILGILKAGGTYLPIDINYPPNRVNYMIQDSNLKLLLIKGQLNHEWNEDIEVLNLENNDLYHRRVEKLPVNNSPEDIAYIIYTSGTTGKPKGVRIRHKSLANTIQWRKKEYDFTEKDTILQLFSFCFDGFVTSFYSPLIAGATNIFVSEDELKDPKLLINSMIKYKVTHFITIPSFFSVILENIDREKLRSLRIITLAGEKLTQNLVRLSKMKCPGVEIVNEYGPTENCVVTTIFRNVEASTTIPIGKPIQNTKVYIINKNNQLQPVGVAGEICVSGIGLASGYLNKPELTKEKFVNNPFERDNDSIYQYLYHTGDLARWLPDGNIEFLGRIDQQVKIRGFRIELGEIENVLLKHDEINEVVVIDKEDQDGNKYLCTYYVSDKEISNNSLRNWLRESLPDYMIPQYFIPISNIPITSTGKMDRSSLPEPNGTIYAGIEYEAPTNNIEKKLASIWQEVLGIECVGINESFFEVGGNSLSIVKVHNLIERIYPRVVKVTDLFTYHSIKAIAELIAEKCSNTGEKEMATVTFPIKYLDKNVQKFLHTTYSFSIKGEVLRKMKLIAANEMVDIEDLLIGIMMYLLADFLEQDTININVMFQSKNVISDITIDFREIESIENLFQLIHQYPYAFTALSELKTVESIISSKDDYFSVSPLFVKKSYNKQENMELFHILVEYESLVDEIEMKCFVSQKILKSESNQLINMYFHLLEKYVLSYEEL
jgi:tyrocidine synthetase-3